MYWKDCTVGENSWKMSHLATLIILTSSIVSKKSEFLNFFLSKSEFKLESQIITKTPTNHFSLISLILAQIRY